MSIQELIESHEGREKFPYTDTTGHITIGIGRNLTGKGLSDDEIEYLFNNDLRDARNELDRIFPAWRQLSPARKDVLVSMMFNLGTPRYLTFKKFWRAMESEDFERAAHEMLDSRWAEQVGTRADELAEMMLDG